MPQTFRVLQIDHVELFVPDREEAARWYREVLGLKVLAKYKRWAENPGGPLMISPDGGSTKLALFAGAPQGKRKSAGFHRVAFRDDAKGFLTFLKRIGTGAVALVDDHGRAITSRDAVDHRLAWSIYFCDPWGHRLEVTSYDYDDIALRLGRLLA